MKSLSNLTKTSLTGFKLSLIALFSSLCVYIPVHAHHPFDGMSPESFNSFQGLISGLSHPILGFDHCLFLVSIGLVGTLSIRRWLPSLLIAGFVGTLSSLFLPEAISGIEIIISLSLLVLVFVFKGFLNPSIILPLISCHGYVLGNTIVGAEPTPLFSYFFGLMIVQTVLILSGIFFWRRFKQYRNPFIFILLVISGFYTYQAII